MGDLDPAPYKQKLSEMYNYVKTNLPSNIEEAHEAAIQEAKENGDDNEALEQLERATLSAAIAEADAMDVSDNLNP